MPIAQRVPISKSIRNELISIFTRERFSDAPEDCLTYAYDATRKEHPPQAVVWAESEHEISALLQLANREGFPIYPRGGGSGLAGGALATHGGILLSLERINQLVELDEANRLVRAQSGILLGDLKSQAQARGLFFPPDPSSAKTASLGGVLANCAGGLNCVKYGTTKDWVQGARVVLPTGEAVSLGGKARKNVVGYNLLQLMIGSEGTLGIITEATLRLIPYPPYRQAFIAQFDSVGASLRTVRAILDSGIVPSAIEFIDKRCLEAANHYARDKKIPVAEALLLVEQDGFDAQLIANDIKAMTAICRENGASEAREAQSEEERLALWEVRKTLSPAMYAIATFKTNEDICVPLSEIEAILDDAYAIGARHGLPTLCFGHAGDGNIHVNYMSERENDVNAERAAGDLFAAVIKRGGSISGEHGIGIAKAPYLSLELSEKVIDVSKQIKRLFDPANILNPAKIFEC